MIDYDLLAEQVKEFAKGCEWDITLYANVSALLFDTMNNINWAGFYLMRDGELALGPFQGKTACMKIKVGKGVCGTAVQEDRTIRVDDVHLFKGHIACDSASASEIVIPIHKDGRIIGVLDIDSPIKSRFSKEDEAGLLQIVHVIEEKI
ncbi:MAG: GAF domain-containing protein [Lachnospiraceae bacterium]|nr:GAF domain-containing protein [Lachnospiraceae bacterium]MBR4815876.1 GAF domain-containing protein [Lachnospiraceae bacterium]